ncbi:MAG: peptide chain release factor 1 [Actinomycetota bacterium]|jgi:peptide chain release factor 1|nr:peptide chain release factor 1 [Actinomycetota bacterium]
MHLPETRLKEMEARFEQVELELADPSVAARPDRLRDLGREHSELKPTVEAWRAYKQAESDLEEAKAMLSGSSTDDRKYLEDEIETQRKKLEALEAQIVEALLPKDPNDDRDVIVEIRAGAGGDEAGLFAADLYRMYSRYAEEHRYKTEVLSANESGVGGYKEIIFAVKGKGAYSRLKHEGGVHRVQRVPVTESSGRIHTSAAGVLVLPEAEEVEVNIDPNDLRIDVYRSSGPGGQSVNTTDSAVRIKHIPTGVEVACQDEKSQLQNKEKAMRILRARLLQLEQEKQQQEQAAERKSQVRGMDRSERIRTYNFPENRVTDHRIGYTVHRLGEILGGDIDDLIDALNANRRDEDLTGDDD